MRLILCASALVLTSVPAMAQYGVAKSGIYPSDYHMQTFTGKLVDFDIEKRQIKLQCDICAEEEIFEATVGDPQASRTGKFMVAPRDANKRTVIGTPRKAAPDEITVGDLLRVYYNERKQKQDGKTVKYNAVFELEKLSAAPPASTQAP